MKTLLKKYFNKESLDEKIKKNIREKLYKDTINRGIALAVFFSVTFSYYGIGITKYLQKFIPNLTIWDNLWPRILFNSIPFLFLAFLLKNSKKISNYSKCIILIFSFGVIFHISCWIYVWPLAIKGNAEILAVVNPANVFVIVIFFIILSPPLQLQLMLLFSFLLLFFVPFTIIGIHTRDEVFSYLVINDSLTAILLGFIISLMIERMRTKLALYEIKQQQEAELFLGPTVSKAIFEKKPELLKTRKISGFFVSMDIRGYTTLMKNLPEEKAIKIMSEYHSMVSKIISSKNGFIHKTIGDGHLISFGAMDEKVDLSAIPNLEFEEKNAELRRNTYISNKLISAIYEITDSLYSICSSQNARLFIGAGVTYGDAEMKLLGDENHRKEFDVIGKVVIEATRLESYSKYLRKKFCDNNSSAIVISPKALIFMDGSINSKLIETKENPVRDFPDIEYVSYIPITYKDTHILAA